MLYHRKHPIQVKKAYNCAAVAKMEGIEFYYFSPGNVRLDENIIHGYVYENGIWLQKEMPLPDVIYNPSGMRTSNQKEVYRNLKKIIPFTSHPIGNKIKVFRKIKQLPEFTNYLIPSEEIIDTQSVLHALNNFGKIVVKPLSGSNGLNVTYIERSEENFVVLDGSNRITVNEAELHSKIETLISNKKFLVQPFISCRTIDGHPYDFRMHVQKNGLGVWSIAMIYPRIGSKNGIISNVSKGGYTGKLKSFLFKEYGIEDYNIKRTLEQFAIHFSEKFDDLYENPLDELGIDIGIDENNKLWIYEVNWRPGYGYRGFDSAMNTIPYAAYLAKQNKHEE